MASKNSSVRSGFILAHGAISAASTTQTSVIIECGVLSCQTGEDPGSKARETKAKVASTQMGDLGLASTRKVTPSMLRNWF